MNSFKIITLILFSTFPLISKSQGNCEFIEKIQNYQDSVKLKSNGDFHIIDSNTFEINTYLSYFDCIELEKDFKIGVYFFDNFLDGKPYLYAIKSNEELNDKNKKSLYEFLNKNKFRAKNHIRPMDSEKGFLQYLFFSEMGEQFALKWHSNYNEKYIICSKKKIDEIVNEFRKYNQEETGEEQYAPDSSVDSVELNKFEKIDPAIKIELEEGFYTITWVENRTHEGIYRCKYKIQRKHPFKIEKMNEELLMEISIGFLY